MPNPADDNQQRDQSAERFLRLVQERRRGRLKIYIGLAAGVGKTYRLLQEAHELRAHGVDVVLGYVETHGRPGTVAQLRDLPTVARKHIFYKGRMLEEMDVQGILQRRPSVVVVDELAHTNVPGSENEKRWQDVEQLVRAGIDCRSDGIKRQFGDPGTSGKRRAVGATAGDRRPASRHEWRRLTPERRNAGADRRVQQHPYPERAPGAGQGRRVGA